MKTIALTTIIALLGAIGSAQAYPENLRRVGPSPCCTTS